MKEIEKLKEELEEVEELYYPKYMVEVGKKGYGLIYDEPYEFDNEEDAREQFNFLKNTIKPNQYIELSKLMDNVGDGAYEVIETTEYDD